MASFIAFLASPFFLRLVMIGVVLEAVALVVWHKRTGRGPRPLLVCSFLGAGLAFLAALYVVRAHDAPSVAFLIALTSALVFHVWHLALLARR
jgi:hypothetical protein